jgi:LuxR family transcriptional regulator, maltose regulon positive regulatory protein
LPDLGTLAGQARALRAQLSADLASSISGPSSLTGAELRVLPMPTTHLSIPEIGAVLFLSLADTRVHLQPSRRIGQKGFTEDL